MKKILFAGIFIIFALVLLYKWVSINTKPVSSDESFKNFVVQKGLSAQEIGEKLESAGLIRNKFIFKFYVQLSGKSAKIQSGEFRISPSETVFEVVGTLTKGPVQIWVTIPEGYRREEVAAKFASGLGKDQKFIDDFLTASKGMEGYLFPDTYLFPRDASASAIVNKLRKTFDAKTADLSPTPDQVILASLIERETRGEEERPIVAGILENRLKAGMPLQVDATIQYAIGNWSPITKDDRGINSPYNTYKFSGLPPAPISNPGLTSISAAVNPAKTDYWYYIHDRDGKIHYAKTITEHNANIAKYLIGS